MEEEEAQVETIVEEELLNVGVRVSLTLTVLEMVFANLMDVQMSVLVEEGEDLVEEEVVSMLEQEMQELVSIREVAPPGGRKEKRWRILLINFNIE